MNHNATESINIDDFQFFIHFILFLYFLLPSCILPLRTSIEKKSVYCGISIKYNNKYENIKQHPLPFKNIANIRKIHVLISN